MTSPEERKGLFLTREQLEAWAGQSLTDDQVDDLDVSIPNSSIPLAIATMTETLYEPEDAEEPVAAEPKTFRVKWYHREEFQCDIELDARQMEGYAEADEDERESILEEMLMDVILNMTQPQLTLAFQGCTDREITETEELET
jgi:hypothetical protein